MDLNLLYGVIIAALMAVISYLLTKKITINKNELAIVQQIFNLSANLIDELNLKNEDKILQISQIIDSGITFAIVLDDGNQKEMVKRYTVEQCKLFGIELTENRKQLIDQLIDIGLDLINNKDNNS